MLHMPAQHQRRDSRPRAQVERVPRWAVRDDVEKPQRACVEGRKHDIGGKDDGGAVGAVVTVRRNDESRDGVHERRRVVMAVHVGPKQIE